MSGAVGAPVPLFVGVRNSAEVAEAWRAWDCAKVVIKPTDRAGSRGVRVLSNEIEIAQAVEHALSQGRSGDLILEEYLGHFSGRGFA